MKLVLHLLSAVSCGQKCWFWAAAFVWSTNDWSRGCCRRCRICHTGAKTRLGIGELHGDNSAEEGTRKAGLLVFCELTVLPLPADRPLVWVEFSVASVCLSVNLVVLLEKNGWSYYHQNWQSPWQALSKFWSYDQKFKVTVRLELGWVRAGTELHVNTTEHFFLVFIASDVLQWIDEESLRMISCKHAIVVNRRPVICTV